MWAPWRIGYVTGERPSGCVFCHKIESDDDDANHVLYRGEQNAVLLNSYPYNSGHLMVVPNLHVAMLEELSPETSAELWQLTGLCARALKEVLYWEGLNIGMNLGQVAGAGISDHLHMHVVPRWNGDTNYMTAVAETRVVPQSLDDSYRQLKPVFDALAGQAGGGPPA
ncbi:MAG: HIT domain-containing protein [Armatimonadota bacterium]|nr:HIT domain-containing protein [Armatimonadota bacterium]